jgi:hypothetical protein
MNYDATATVQSANVDVKKGNDKGMKARGEACAELFFKSLQDQATTMLRYLADLVSMNQAGREAFRVTLRTKRDESRQMAKVHALGSDQMPVARGASASAMVRISEAIRVSEAIDAGWTPDLDFGYHWNVSEARTFLDSKSAAGPKAKRGPKVLTKVQKAANYIERLGLTAAQRHALAAILAAS